MLGEKQVSDELHVYLATEHVGQLSRTRSGRAEFTYDADWQSRADAHPLSLSMPLAARQHGPSVVEPYLWGLLPDNELILDAWARRFHVSARNALALLAHVGADCPGAVRLVRSKASKKDPSKIEWLDSVEIAERLRRLRKDISAWRIPSDTGQFSLAGAQPKTALCFDGKRWGLPSGSTPTTHILKPGVLALDGSAYNEHFCLNLARELGLPAAASTIERFEDEIAIVVARYDRRADDHGVQRIHQEDLCQALGVHPARKYQNEGGPGPRAIAQLLREASTQPAEDIGTFLSALALNWLIAGTDAHAKNYSLLIGVQGRSRLAPLYDIASALPYPDMPAQKLKLAMKIGGKYRLRDIGRYEWEKLGQELGLAAEHVLSVACQLARQLPDASSTVLSRMGSEGAEHAILPELHAALVGRSMKCVRLLGTA